MENKDRRKERERVMLRWRKSRMQRWAEGREGGNEMRRERHKIQMKRDGRAARDKKEERNPDDEMRRGREAEKRRRRRKMKEGRKR